jgi:hypothetical protein
LRFRAIEDSLWAIGRGLVMSILDVSATQIMGLWEQLLQCVHGTNSYGGSVAEIYLYTVMPRDPYTEHNRESEHAREAFAAANQTLYDLCRMFEKRNGVRLAMFEGWDKTQSLDRLIATPHDPWTHRVHIGMARDE